MLTMVSNTSRHDQLPHRAAFSAAKSGSGTLVRILKKSQRRRLSFTNDNDDDDHSNSSSNNNNKLLQY